MTESSFFSASHGVVLSEHAVVHAWTDEQTPKRVRGPKPKALRLIKGGIWLYFLLLIFEGALRKWVLPGLATPLLVVRDPVAMAIIWMAIQHRCFPKSIYVYGFMAVGYLSVFTALMFGHGSIIVAAYGTRVMVLHIPLAFIIGKVFSREDVVGMARAVLLLAIPMALLIGLQFYSPQSAWVNRGVGGDLDGAGFTGAMGFSRPPGTFSFTSGLTLFFGFTAALVVFFWLTSELKSKPWLLWGASAAVVIALPLSISRALFFQVAIIIVFAIAVIIRQPRFAKKLVLASIVIGLTLTAATYASFFQTATEVMGARFESAGKSEGGLQGTLINRFLGGLLNSFTGTHEVSFFGAGIGFGTNVGAKYFTGRFGFLIAEGEWGRTVGELGPLLGMSVVLMRVSMAFGFMARAYRKLVKSDPLPWMLLSTGFLLIILGGWAQPTSLGFYTLITGLIIASLKKGRVREAYHDGHTDAYPGVPHARISGEVPSGATV